MRRCEKSRIHAHDEITPGIIMTRQMPTHDVIGYGKEAEIWAFGTFDLRLLTDAGHPFIATGRDVAGFTRFTDLKSPGIDIVPAREYGIEKGDLCRWRRQLRNCQLAHHRTPATWKTAVENADIVMPDWARTSGSPSEV